MKSSSYLTIENRRSVGNMSVVLYDARTHEGCNENRGHPSISPIGPAKSRHRWRTEPLVKFDPKRKRLKVDRPLHKRSEST